MRIEWATHCKSVSEHDGAVTLTGINMDTALAEGGLPMRVGAQLAVNIAARYDEMDGETAHVLRCRVLGPDLTPQYGVDERFVLLPPDALFVPGAEGRQIIVVQATFVAETEGQYQYVLDLDGGEPVTLPYYVRAIPEL